MVPIQFSVGEKGNKMAEKNFKDGIYCGEIVAWIILGVVQHFHHFHKSTESTLFHDLPSPQKVYIKKG